MKILVAGTGFIGSSIVEELEEEHEVRTLDRSGGDFQADISEEFEIDEKFDVLYHTIGLAPGMNSRELYEKVHIEGTRNLLDAVDCEKVIYLSALGVGEVDHSFFQTKKEAEELIKDSGKNYTIVRPSTVYGEGNKLLEMMKKGAPLRVFPDIKTETQPIHIGDLTEILARAAEEFDGETLKLGGPEAMTVGELARKLYREEGFSCLLLPVPRILQETGIKLIPLSGPFSDENIQLLRQQNTVEENDAERILGELRKV
jgi:nucleoside-diphosphate-sugar epimerase